MIKLTMFTLATLLMAQAALAESTLKWDPDMPKIRFRPIDVRNVTYTQKGYRFGYIPKIENTYGWKQEGRMLMGYGSSDAPILDQICMDEGQDDVNAWKDQVKRLEKLEELKRRCLIDTNPFIFSMVDKELYNEFNGKNKADGQASQYKGLPVVAYYIRESLSLFGPIMTGAFQTIFARTESFIKKMWPVDPTLDVPIFYANDAGESVIYNEGDGFIQGTIVKATLDNLLIKTYEITVQEGIGNNAFVRMSVNEKAMFDHLVMAMRTGDQVKLRYIRYWPAIGALASIRGYSTYLRIVSMERVPGNNGLGTLPARSRNTAR